MSIKKKNIKTKQERVFVPSLVLALTLVVVIPLIHVKSVLDPVLYPRFTAWSVSLLLLLLLVGVYRKRIQLDFQFLRSGFFYTLTGFLIVSIISLAFAINPVEGLTDVFKWLLFSISIFLILSLLKASESTLNIIFKAIIINAGIAIIIGIYQYFTQVLGNHDPNAIYEMKGLMAHKNQFSISLFLMLPFLFSSLFILERNWKKLNVIVLLLVLILIFILQTRAVWIALFFSGIIASSLLLLSFSKNGLIDMNSKLVKKLLVSVLAIFALLLVLFIVLPEVGLIKLVSTRISSIFDLGSSSNEGRLQMWDATYRLFLDNQIIGVGGGNWKISIYPYYSEYLPSVFKHWRNPHNDFLGIAAEKGILGLLAFIAMFAMLIYYSIRLIFKSKTKNDILLSGFMLFGLLGFLIISFFSFPAERMNHLIFVALISAVVISIYSRRRRVKKTKATIAFPYIFIPLFIILSTSIYFGIICLNAETQMAKVFVLKEKKEWKQMEYYVDKANSKFVPLEPNHTIPIILFKGLANFEQQKYETSLIYFKEAYKKHPYSVSVLNNLGSAFGQLNIIDSSMVYQRKSLEIFPHYERGLTNLSKSYYLKKDYVKAYQIILCCDPESKNMEVGQIRGAVEQKLLE